jgi:transposase-like protein
MSDTKEAKNGNFKNLLEVAESFKTDQECRDYLEQLRWNGKRTCPHCGCAKTYKYKSGKIFKCGKCRMQFSVTKGTIFESSHVPLRKWFFAMYLMTSHKKGISSCQLARDIGVTQKTAWFMAHRIRLVIKAKSFRKPLEGTIEADETYIGGKSGNKRHHKRGRSLSQKTPVFGMVERESGEVRCQPVERTNKACLQSIIHENVKPHSKLFTDDWPAYRSLGKEYVHEVIYHSYKQYVNGEVHTNTIEGFWSLLKRGILGIYHYVSPKHLARYCDEFGYRFNTRKSDDTPRFDKALANCEGRLTYAALIQ